MDYTTEYTIEELVANLKEANHLIRSVKCVVEREGHYTNWGGLAIQVDKVLAKQRKILYPPSIVSKLRRPQKFVIKKEDRICT
jgi:hypothetical protein